jgi:hypothetical protein
MSDGITDASREDAKNIERWKKSAKDQLLSTFSKNELMDELCKRERVIEIICPDNISGYCVGIDRSDGKEIAATAGNGPTKILVVKE